MAIESENVEPGAVSKVDARQLMELVRPDAIFVRRGARRQGLIYVFAVAPERHFDFMIAVHADADAAQAAFERQSDLVEEGPTAGGPPYGDASAYWDPGSECDGLGGSFLSRRTNVVTYLRGWLSRAEYTQLAKGIDLALRDKVPPVWPGMPAVPHFSIETPEDQGRAAPPFVGGDNVRLPLRIEPPFGGELEFFAPDFQTIEIELGPTPTVVFHPIRAGVQVIEVVAFVENTNVIGSSTTSIYVRPAGDR